MLKPNSIDKKRNHVDVSVQHLIIMKLIESAIIYEYFNKIL